MGLFQDVRSQGVKSLFLKYGTPDCMKKSTAAQPRSRYQWNEAALACDLEFPVVPAFVSMPPRVDFQAMLRRIEESLPWRSTRPGEMERRAAGKVPEEFVL